MRFALPLLAAALLTLGDPPPAAAQGFGFGQGPGFGQGSGFGGGYRSPFPPAAWGPPGPGFGAPGWGPPGWGGPPPGVFPPPAPVLPPPAAPPYVPTGQSEIARPDPFGPPVRIEPRAKETSVGGVTARRYDYSFDVFPLPAPGGFTGALPGAPPDPGWNGDWPADNGAAW